ncbi:non-ribosomal peptide synthetase [Paraburkholderia kururiensis]|uniref:non-ribosomal peptide synthetase n=3 Tax=Paraburkholderia kururiensis TaxID=984307 RepID=UPI000F89B5C9|nr:non-ribosomal peptide synthetase [Paraburkholderia kururiensis]
MQANQFDLHFLPARVARFANERPHATAVVDRDGPLNWQDLWAWSGRLASKLAHAHVQPGDRVAIACPRGAAFVASVLAVWRLRGCYVPLDPALPAARLRWQAQDCAARVIVGSGTTLGEWWPEGVPLVDAQSLRVPHDADTQVAPMLPADDSVFVWPAYVIYTSGSTGQPKGVVLSHAALAAYLRSLAGRLPDGIASAAWISTPAADLGHTALFGALWHGWTLHAIDADVAGDPDAFGTYMDTHAVDLLKIVPSHLDALMQGYAPASVLPRRCLVVGGEAAPARLAAQVALLRSGCVLINHYGPTETAVGVLTHTGDAGRATTLPLGTPLAHVEARIIDADGNAVPKGVTGELCVGGASVAYGFLGRPSLTAERFVPDSAGHGARLYRTGDKSRRLPRGEFAFLGRLDDQVKIRGFRVEPEEIAARLRAEEGVRDAIVIARADEGDGSLKLAAYLTSSAPLDIDAIRARLAAQLPDYMVPSSLQVLAALPLTANGKVDRAALPASCDDATAQRPVRIEPRNESEHALAAIWKQVLKREDIGVSDNFFEIGGDSILSLQIIAKARRAGLKLTPKQMFDYATIEAAARVAIALPADVPMPGAARPPVAGVDERVVASEHNAAEEDEWFAQAGVARDAVEAVYSATPMQQGLLFHGMFAGDPGLYVSQLRLTLANLRVDAMRRAWAIVVARHPVLRTRFVCPPGGEPLQVVERHAALPFDLHPLQAETADAYEAAFQSARASIEARGFDLQAAPLMRVDAFVRPDGAHDVLWTHHHALTDGWSTAQVASEVVRAYAALVDGHEPGMTPDATSGSRYVDYVRWLRRQPDVSAFWRTRLAAFQTSAGLADALGGNAFFDSNRVPRGAAGSSANETRRIVREIGAMDYARAQRAARRAQVTLNTLVQAAWALVLAHFSGRGQVVFGTTVSGRPAELPAAQSIVGLFINSLPLAVDIEPAAPIAAWLAALQRSNAELREVEHTPLASLQQWAGVRGSSLFDSLVVFENYPLDEAIDAKREAVGLRGVDAYSRTHLPLTLVAAPRGTAPQIRGEGLRIEWHWHAAHVSENAVLRLATHFERVLDRMAQRVEASDDARLRDIALDAVTADAGRTSSTFPFEAVTTRIETQARVRPDAVAIRFTGDDGVHVSVTYRELNAWSARIAQGCLRVCAGAGERRIGVAMTRSPALVAAILGVLRSGAAYVPLDPAYPDDRLREIALDAGLDAVLTEPAHMPRFASLLPGVALLDESVLRVQGDASQVDATFAQPHAQQLAYVIYTSGSTGRPKGVGITHADMARLFDATQSRFGFNGQDVWTLFHSYAFDFSVWEIFGALVHGGRLVIVPHWTAREPSAFHALLRCEGVTVLNQTPSAFVQLTQADRDNTLTALRTVIFGGERLEPASIARWAEGAKAKGVLPSLVNMYGITETTVHVTYRLLDDAALEAGRSVIGAPLDDLTLQVLDGDLNRVPVGAVGELYVGGAGLARGYLGRPGLTAERFVPDPYGEPGARLYRSGDVARRLPDGDLEYLGRNDAQVKVRGFRIEPGEIEAALLAHEAVREAAVVVAGGEGTEKRLVAYVVPENGGTGPDVARWQTWLSARLPSHMVPSSYVELERLPLTPNGKLDRRALPVPEFASTSPLSFVAPRDETEAKLAAIWQDVLGVDRVGARDDFFRLGGHSLLAVRAISAMRAVFGDAPTLRALFEHPVLEDFASIVRGTSSAQAEASTLSDKDGDSDEGDSDGARQPIVDYALSAPIPLSASQESLWFIWKLDPRSSAYHVSGALRFDGRLDVDALRAAFAALSVRHPALRMRFGETEGVAHQRVDAGSAAQIRLLDLQRPDASAEEATLTARLSELAREPFDLMAEPPVRATLVRLADNQHVLHLVLHHIVGDDWSVGLLFDDFSRLYRAFAAGRAGERGDATAVAAAAWVTYCDVMQARAAHLTAEREKTQLNWWRTELATDDETAHLLALPFDRIRTDARRAPGARLHIRVPAATTEALRALADKRQATLFMALLAAFDALLYRYTGQRDIRIGVPLAGRDLPGAANVAGFFVNTVVLRTAPHGAMHVGQLIDDVRERLLGAYANQDVPFARVVKALQPERDLARTPLFQVLVNQQQHHDLGSSFGDALNVTVQPTDNGEAQFDLMLNIAHRPDAGLDLAFTYATDVFDASTIERLAHNFAGLLDAWATDPELPLASFELPELRDEPTPRAKACWPEPLDVASRIAMHAAQRGDAIALIDGEHRVTYAQLDAWSRAIAAELKRRGVKAETRVGVAMQRSTALVAALLGVLRSGATYVPLDPSYPRERLAHIVEDARLGPIVADAESLAQHDDLFAWRPVIDAGALRNVVAGIEEARFVRPHAQQLAYVIYTSGSTGRPKGVGITHADMARLFDATQSRFGFNGQDVWTLFHSYAFDFSVWEIFGALVHGGRLVIVPHWTAREPSAFHALLRREGVTVLNQTPSAFVQLTQADRDNTLTALRTVIFGGERLEPASIARWAEGAKAKGVLPSLVNMYGITETTVHVTYRLLDDAALKAGRSVIGAPLDDLTLQVLDADLNRVPVGAVGELYVGGAGLARGYLGRAGLTAERFVPDPYGEPGARLYRSGDVARRLPDGDLEYLGRNDAQVKLRGFRIEPGEIEAVLLAHEAVREAAVVVAGGEGAEKRLVAYVVPESSETGTDIARWQTWLSARLPSHMVPTSYVELERLPLTPNGKLDRRALPAPEATSTTRAVAPSSPDEEALLAVWRNVLRRDDIGVTDNFFVVGGDSILSLQIVAKARDAGLHLTPRMVFEAPTVESLARAARAASPQHARGDAQSAGTGTSYSTDLWRALGLAPEHIEDVYPATPLQSGLLYHSLAAEPGQTAYLNQMRVTLTGTIDGDAMRAAWQAAFERHAVLRTCFAWSHGGEAMQIVHRRLTLPFDMHDWSAAGDYDARLAAWRERDLAAGMALDAAPLMRVALFVRDARTVDLVWTHHHVLLDGWSVASLVGEILRDYRARVAGTSVVFESTAPYRQYVEWIRAAASDAETQAWWRERIAQAFCEDDPATLTASVPAPRVQEAGTHARRQRIDATLASQLQAAARRYEVTLNTLMQGAWAVVLARYGHRRSVAYGTTFSGRPAHVPGIDRMLGLFINTLPVWVEVKADADVGVWLRDLQQAFATLRQYEHTPLAQVQQWAGRSGDALFDSLVVFENYPVDVARDGDGDLEIGAVESVDPTHYPLALAIIPRAQGLALEWSWDGARIDRTTVERLATHYETVLRQLAEDSARRVGELELLTRGSGEAALTRYPFMSLGTALVAQAQRAPSAVAVRCEDESLGYGELDAWSAAVARQLMERGAGAEHRVGLCVRRGPALIAALVGIIRSGAAFVPLDPEYPAARLTQMMQDAGITRVVADAVSAQRMAGVLAGCEVIDVREAGVSGMAPAGGFTAALHPDQLAYVLYTSGSTGRPKGVAVSHGALWTHLQDFLATYGISAADTVLHSSTVNFDVALHETLPALLTGATVEMRGEQPWDLQGLGERLVSRGVTFARIPTALWQQWQRHAPPREALRLRQVTVGGEALPGDALAHWREGPLGDIRLDNLYGPTETTIAALYRRTQDEDTGEVTVPIGRPYPGRTARVLDAFGDGAPVGGLGELCIGGPTVARGYLGRAALTAERFVPDPYGGPGARQYRSGDLCRMRADGTVEFLGRLDQQVKLRGQRIEPGEIEAVLRQCPGVREAAVVVTGEGEKRRLAAYVSGCVSGDVQPDTLQRTLEQKLPGYMVPSSVTVLERLPWMPSGKLDRAALPPPQEVPRGRVGPSNELEALLLSVWCAVLGREDLGVTENFFEAGGDSIQSLQIIAKARQAGLKLTPRQVFEHPTVAALAQRVERLDVQASANLVEDDEPLALTPIQRLFFERYPQGESHWNQAVLLKVRGRLDVPALERAARALAQRHDALRLRFVKREEGWKQVAAHEIDEGVVRSEPLASLSELEAACGRIQASLDIERGPVWRLGYFEMPEGETRLLVAIHHLSVDGVSWRVLLDELQTAYGQAERCEPVTLPAASTSWRTWVRHLLRYAQTEPVQSEASWWQQALSTLDATADLPFRPAAGTRMAHSATLDWTLDAARTRDLLQNASRAYRTRVDELLLAALARALGKWSGAKEVAVELEGHGREDVIDGVDLSRTVGWFTTRFPVALPAAHVAPGDALVAVKTRVRAVPHKGLHWGLLDASRERRRPAVSFNYLGRFDQSLDADSRFTFSAEPAGATHGDGARLDYALDLNGIVTGDTLLLRWRFDPARIDRETVERLVADFDFEVGSLIAHCMAAPPGASASDFPLSGLDDAQLRAFGLRLGSVADIYPATPLQQGLLYHSELAHGQGVYVNQLQLTLAGPFDANALRAAWQAAVARHDALRTRFVRHPDGMLMQVVEREAALPFVVHDWRDIGNAHASDYEARLATWRKTDLAAGIDASQAPLMRVNVFLRPDGRFDLVRTHHHVLTDGWSGARLLSEVFDDYERALGARHEAARVATVPPPYRRYVEWLAKQPDPRDWWLERLAALDDPGTLTASLAAPRESPERAPTKVVTQKAVTQRAVTRLDAALDQRVRRAAQRHRVTLNTLMQGAWAVLLTRLSGKSTVAFGVTVSGRPAALAGAEEVFGLFINSLPVFVRVPGEAAVSDWLAEVQRWNVEMREVEHTPLASLQQWAGRSGDVLFDSLIVFENYPVAARAERVTGSDASRLRVERVDAVERTHYPLTLTILPAKQLELHWGWDSRRLDQAQIAALQRHYLLLLDALAEEGEHAARFIGDVVVQRGAPHAEALPETAWLACHERFAAEAARVPTRIAVRQHGAAVDYATLARWAAAIDARLRASGVAREERVAVCMRRSPALIASMLGVWRSGAAYVPLDPSFPADRLRFMLDDAGITRIIADTEGIERLQDGLDGRIVIDADLPANAESTEPLPARPVTADQLAYVIYTSGSTGRPKGVAVSHGALARLIASVGIAPGLSEHDVLLSVTTSSFDISLLEFCLPLTKGACIELADAQTAGNGEALAALIETSGATAMQATPSGWRLLVEAGWRGPADGRGFAALSGGEVLAPDLAAQLMARGVSLWNLYGPTETTIWSTCARLVPREPVTIGRALHANTLRIVDASGALTLQGGIGELCIGGDNLARGYLGRAALTAERFVPDPWGPPGARMYRTGDLARERREGDIECLGRIDQQVKLRGYRIEPGEIEAALREFDGVSDAAVALVPGVGTAEPRLIGYVVASDGRALPQEWRAMLRARLPAYMVPAAIHVIDALPRTANGKLDRNALARFGDPSADDASWAEPVGEAQTLIAQAFGEVLGIARVGADDDFFAMGGHSLAAVRVIARLSEGLGRKVALAMLFDASTPARLAAALAADAPDAAAADAPRAQAAALQALDGLFDELD